MALSIDKIKAQTKAAFAKPNLFRVDFTFPNLLFRTSGIKMEKLSLNCFQATIPGLSVATTDKDQGFRSIAYSKLYEDITLGFYCSNDYAELDFLQSWMNQIAKADTSRMGFYEDYIADMDIVALDSAHDEKKNVRALTTEIKEAYPKNISSMQMDYGTVNTASTITATFTYRYYNQVYHALDKVLPEVTNTLFNEKSLATQVLGKTKPLESNELSKPKTIMDTIGNGSSGSFKV